jgi:hypothetical protein
LPCSQESATGHCLEPADSSPRPHIVSLRSILILSSHLRLGLPSGLSALVFPNEMISLCFSHLSHACCISNPSHLWFDYPNIWRIVKLHGM